MRHLAGGGLRWALLWVLPLSPSQGQEVERFDAWVTFADKGISSPEAQADAFRAEGYPFKPGDWEFGEPPTLAVEAESPPPALLGDALSIPVSVDGPGTLSVRYVLVDPSAADPETTIVASGEATGEDGSFTVDIGSDVTSVLFPSVYQLYLLATSDELARVAEQVLDVPIGV